MDTNTLSGALRDARRFIASFHAGDFGAHEYKTVKVAAETLTAIDAALAAQPEAVASDAREGGDDAEMEEMFRRGREAWKDVPDGAAWVRDLRGTDEDTHPAAVRVSDAFGKHDLWWLQDAINSILRPNGGCHADELQSLHDRLAALARDGVDGGA